MASVEAPSKPRTAPPRQPTPAEVALELVENLDAMVAYWDLNEVNVFANRAYLDWFGKTKEQMVGITLEQLLGPIYPKNLPYLRAAYGGQVQVFEREIPAPDGRLRSSLATYRPHFVDGVVRGLLVHVVDVTALKRIEQRHRESEERLELVLEATGAGAWDWNIETGEVFFSNYWMASLGYPLDEAPRTAAFWESLIHPDDLPRVRRALAEHFEGQTPTYECVDRLRRKDGSWRWNLDRGRVVKRTPEGKPLRMVGTDSDLSEQRWSGLTELIPICAGCKRIRRADGRWEGLEKHFSEGSRAQFSHGLCDDCIHRYYGDVLPR